jgi:hypothetical protein
MAKYKFQAVQQLLSRGVDVVVADTDTAWLRNPLPEFARLAEADILTSTDVLRRMPIKEQLHSTLNIGIMLFRARPGAIDFVTTFYTEMVNDPAFGTGNAEWDQARFNRMVREGLALGPHTQSWASGWGGRVKVEALDIVDFPNGHVYFAQRLPQALKRVPFIVHATFQCVRRVHALLRAACIGCLFGITRALTHCVHHHHHHLSLAGMVARRASATASGSGWRGRATRRSTTTRPAGCCRTSRTSTRSCSKRHVNQAHI